MTVTAEVPLIEHTANGVATVFAYDFELPAASDLLVQVDGVTKTLTTDYSVSGFNDPAGGSITFVAAPANLAKVLLRRNIAFERTTDYQNLGDFLAPVVNEDFDRIWFAVQQLQADLRRMLRAPEYATVNELPTIANRASKLLGWDSTGQPIAVAPTSGSASDLALDLASTASAAEGAGQIGYDVDLAYTSGTSGHALHSHGRILQGADPTGVADSTAALRAMFDLCIPSGYEAVIPAGTYKVTDRISSVSTLASGSLNLRLTGDVTINVDAASTPFLTLLSCYTTAANNIKITGGRLTINGNNVVGNAIYCRHAGQGGSVVIENLRIINIKNVNAGASENQALLVHGRYNAGRLGVIEVDTVDRSGSGTATKGVTFTDIQGPFKVQALKVSRVLSTGFTADADGFYCSGYTSGGATTERAGSVHIDLAEFEDCQGRSVKVQMQHCTIGVLKIKRQAQATFDVADVDFQYGHGAVESATLTYLKNSGSSLLHASFYPFAVQQSCSDMATRTRIGNVTLRAEMQLPRLVQVVVGNTALNNSTTIDGVELQPYGAMSGSHFARAVVEFAADQVAASSNKTHIAVRRVRGDFSAKPILGHTGFSASVASKLSWEVTDNVQSGTYASGNSAVGAVSGSVIPAVLSFVCRDNSGVSDLMAAGWTFDYQTLSIGCRFQYDLATGVASNAPGSLGSSGYAMVEVLGSIGATTGFRNVRVTKDNAASSNTVFYTQTGTWGTIK